MSIYQFLVILAVRKKLALSALAIAILVGVMMALMMPKKYESSTTLIINYKGVDTVTGAALSPVMKSSYMATQLDIISSPKVGLKVVEELNLDKSPAVIESFNEATQGQGDIKVWLAKILISNLSVEPSSSSSAITLSYKGDNPEFITKVVNAFAKAYIETNLELKVEPSLQAAKWFNKQVASLRENLRFAQHKLSTYQRVNGIVSLDKRLDIENARLSQLSTQLVSAQAKAIDSASRLKDMSGDISLADNPDIMNNSMIQSMKSSLSAAEAKLAEVRQRLNIQHPDYQSALAEVKKLKSQLNSELKLVTNSLASVAELDSQRVKDLQDELEKQKKRILDINEQRDQMALLQNDVLSAQKSLDVAMDRFSQTSMEGQASYGDVIVLTPGTVPLTYSSPNEKLIIIISVLLGIMLALGVALIAELIDRRVRTPEDVIQSLGIPVLSVLEYQESKYGFFKKILS